MAKITGNELGYPGNMEVAYDFTGSAFYRPQPVETTPELMWPFSVAVYDQMRKTDSQIGGLLRAMFMPILAANWQFDTEGVRPEVVKLCETEVGLRLKKKEARQRRRRQGIVFLDHLRTALLVAPYGHMVFEQVYEVTKPEQDQEEIGLKAIAHLRKLSPRFPRTLRDIHVAKDGGLLGVTQEPVDNALKYEPKFIPVDRLVFYCLDREGADWTGSSVLRQCYKNWMIRDVLIRLSAQIVERNGMGVPDMVYDGDLTTKAEASAAVRNFRSGAEAGMVRPLGTSFSLVGVTGQTVDPLPVIAYHDQAIAKSALAMFMDLGHDTGARSLGETFVDVFTNSLQALADQVAEVFTEHVIRDLVEHNFGPDEPYPVLTPGDMSSQAKVSATTLNALTGAGLITPDGKLENHLRERYGLPPVDKASRPEPPKPPVIMAPEVDPGDVDKDAEDPPKPDPKEATKPGAKVKVTEASGIDYQARARELYDRIRELKHVPTL